MTETEFLNKGVYNHDFYVVLTEKFPHDYYDWRITVMFYCAIHCLKAFCLKNYGKYIGDTHHEIIKRVSPKGAEKIVDLPDGMWDEYHALYQYSKIARYEGITNHKLFEQLMKDNYKHASQHLTKLKMYFKTGSIIIK